MINESGVADAEAAAKFTAGNKAENDIGQGQQTTPDANNEPKGSDQAPSNELLNNTGKTENIPALNLDASDESAEVPKEQPNPNEARSSFPDTQRLFGEEGTIYNIIAQDPTIAEQAQNEIDTLFEERGEKVARELNGTTPDIPRGIQLYKESNQEEYKRLIAEKIKEIIEARVVEMSQLPMLDGVKTMFKDTDVQSETVLRLIAWVSEEGGGAAADGQGLFGEDGTIYNIVAQDQETVTQIEAEMATIIAKGGEKVARELNGTTPDIEQGKVIYQNSEEYKDLLKQKTQEVIKARLVEISSLPPTEALSKILTMLNIDETGGEEDETEGPKDTEEKKKESALKRALKLMGVSFGQAIQASSFSDFVTALLVSGAGAHGEGFYGKNFREGKESNFGPAQFDEVAKQFAKKLNIEGDETSKGYLKYGYNALIVGVVQTADKEIRFRDTMSSNGINLNDEKFRGILQLGEEDLKQETPDGVLQQRILGLYELMKKLADAGKVTIVDDLFKETFKQKEIPHAYENDLTVSSELCRNLGWIGGSKDGYNKFFNP